MWYYAFVFISVVFFQAANAQVKFNQDSAYHFVQKQVSFGPRVPGTDGHDACAKFLINKLESYGAQVTTQKFSAILYNQRKEAFTNIIASFNPKVSPRILLAAHWDTRPLADKDSINKSKPIAGANDGASGTAILLEIGRQLAGLNPKKLNYGVDIILFDGEDQGEPSGYKLERTIENAGIIYWCLGSQYWAENPHQADYKAKFGILLDMVGAPEARFFKEGGSMQFAGRYMNKVWRIARKAGFEDFFINEKVSGIMDDHIFVSKDADIPMLNIVHLDLDNQDNFADYHHTHADNIKAIDKITLHAVGSTVLNVIIKK